MSIEMRPTTPRRASLAVAVCTALAVSLLTPAVGQAQIAHGDEPRVAAEYAADEIQLAAFFRQEPGMPVSLYTSVDGTTFQTPTDGAVPGGGSNVYDPSIMYWGGYFWIASGVRVSGKPGIAVKYSSDLRTWSDLWTQTVPNSDSIPGPDLIGAEWFQEDGKVYIVASIGQYWASNGTPLGRDEKLRAYTLPVSLPKSPSPLSAFVLGNASALKLDNDADADRIDGFIRRDDASGLLQFFVKPRATEPIEMWTSSSIDGTWTRVNPNLHSLRVDDDYRMMEAPSVSPIGGRFAVYSDNFNHRYANQDHVVGMMVSFTDAFHNFTTPQRLRDANGEPLNVRHGTVINVTDPHAKCVVWAFRNETSCTESSPSAVLRASLSTNDQLNVANRAGARYTLSVTNEGGADATVDAVIDLPNGAIAARQERHDGVVVPARKTVSIDVFFAPAPGSAGASYSLRAKVEPKSSSTVCASSIACAPRTTNIVRSGTPLAPDEPYMRQQGPRTAAQDCLPQRMNSAGGQNVTLCWGAPEDDGGSPITRYLVSAVDATTGETLASRELSSSTLQWTFYGLPGQRLYRVSVAAVTRQGSSPISTPTYREGDVARELKIWVANGLAFSDVSPDRGWWNSNDFTPEITWMAASGTSTGYDDGTYRPKEAVSREAMAAFLYRVAGSPKVNSSSAFVDVPQNNQFATAIAWMAQSGVSTGWPDGTYRPAEPVTREAMAAFIYRFAHAGEPVSTTTPFVDVESGSLFWKPITWMSEQQISTGWQTSQGREYRPKDAVTREAMAAFLFRFMHLGTRPSE